MKALLDFPALVAGAAEALEPHRVASYLHDTARLVHTLVSQASRARRAGSDHERAALPRAREPQIVLRNGLAVLGISAPERM